MTTNPKMIAIEMAMLYVFVPLTLALPLPLWKKLSIVSASLLYCVYISYRLGLFTRTTLLSLAKPFANRTVVWRFASFALISTSLMWLFYPERFFFVVLNKPLLWLAISVFYAVFSVYPQEFLYRTLFFTRYRQFFQSSRVLITVNAMLFSFAHIMFGSPFVMALTLGGGLLFAHSYHKTQSLMYVSVEHSAYGLWLYTLGMGHMLAFPG